MTTDRSPRPTSDTFTPADIQPTVSGFFATLDAALLVIGSTVDAQLLGDPMPVFAPCGWETVI